MTVYAVIAQNGSETWSYGPFINQCDAFAFEQRAAEECPEIDYDTVELLTPEFAAG